MLGGITQLGLTLGIIVKTVSQAICISDQFDVFHPLWGVFVLLSYYNPPAALFQPLLYLALRNSTSLIRINCLI